MPLGWHVGVYRQKTGGASPATFEGEKGGRLAVWQANLWGLDWVRGLVKNGSAIDLGGNGYPLRYTARSSVVMPYLVDEPPNANKTWVNDEGDILLPNWLGATTKDLLVIRECQPDEWLIIEAWDES